MFNSTHHGHEHGHGHRDRPLGQLVNELISPLAPYSAIILTVTACCITLFRIYVLDVFVPKLYGHHFEKLNHIKRRSFINHHVAAIMKVVVFTLAAYPFLRIAAFGGLPNKPASPGSKVTLGDLMVVTSNVFTGMYVFELFYRDNTSPISVAHHIGAIVIAQAAIVMSINWNHQADAIHEFVICFVWGAFDVVAEFWPHPCMILYRIYEGEHHFQYKMLTALAILELAGTTIETGIVMWLFGSLWDTWSSSLKIMTPILHVLFSAAQLHGARIFWGMAKAEKRKALKEKEGLDAVIANEGYVDESEQSKTKGLPSSAEKLTSHDGASKLIGSPKDHVGSADGREDHRMKGLPAFIRKLTSRNGSSTRKNSARGSNAV